jgi:hypothetical protein
VGGHGAASAVLSSSRAQIAAFRQSGLATKVPMPKGGKDQELPDTDSRFLCLIDSTLHLQSPLSSMGLLYESVFRGIEGELSAAGLRRKFCLAVQMATSAAEFTRVWPRSGDD